MLAARPRPRSAHVAMGLVAACGVLAAAQPAPVIPKELLSTRYTLSGAAVCNDGSPASYYYRNCSANWDRKPGANDYCEKGGPEGPGAYDFVIHFAMDEQISTNGGTQPPADPTRPQYCWDAATCAARRAAAPWLMTSSLLNDTISPGGLMCAGAEINPNFYKAISAVVPYCSSDLWLGTEGGGSRPHAGSPPAYTFAGLDIATAAIKDMLATKDLARADNIWIVGGVGIMANLGALTALLPKTAVVKAVCDGCVVLDDTLLPPMGATVSPAVAITRGLEYWRPDATAADSSAAAKRILWPGLKDILAAQPVKVAAQQPLFDSVQLAMHGATDPSAPGYAAYIARFADAVEVAVRSFAFGFAAACPAPVSAYAAENPYYNIKVDPDPRPDDAGQGFGLKANLDTLSGFFLRDTAPVFHAVDKCREVGCNPTC